MKVIITILNVFIFFSLIGQTIGTGYYSNLSVCADGSLMTWGHNGGGELGTGASVPNSNTPVLVPSLNGAVAVTGGDWYGAALKSDGTVWSWGDDGTGSFSTIPVQITGLSGIIEITGGSDHTMALKSDGTVWAWGSNYQGYLGNGTTTPSPTPVQVNNLDSVIAISSKGRNCLALKSDSTVWAWGRNDYGSIGDGTIIDRHEPVQVSTLSGIISISTSVSSSFALKNDGTVWAWGYNSEGELGIGTTMDEHLPVQLTGISDVKYIASGWYHSAAIKNDGTLWTWGFGEWTGALGTGIYETSSSPIQVTSLDSVIAFTGGRDHSLFLKSDGSVWSSGLNDEGQLGDGTYTPSASPVQVINLCQVSNSLSENTELSNYTLYPNPVNDFLFVKGVGNEEVNVKILDYAGKCILEETKYENGIITSSLKPGIYIILLNTDHQSSSLKFIKK